ncbi:hypothetical protein HYH03_016125 [Edaphochlamys debaryana]|uniref:Uncharacterized protein n=1 Tax=Edaphochlamys debaryana TaxID=47281 RepID=A0A836BRS7_9CHLO|nr:hypothetical protein HYH03_016125 [Edaphochlamys debaryana]|eukprot:KAG2485139.1 hypothetical protein HYH03_016125 [Edaphochlamys debaryana]
MSPPPNDFELADESGTSAFILAKRFGKEEILVRVNLDSQPDFGEDEDEDEYEEEDEEGLPVEFSVTIGKDGDDVLTFECESDGEYLTIHNVSLEAMDREEEAGPPPYAGPLFEDLDDTLQQAFVDYLEERGVNAYLGEWIRIYLKDKSSLEYQKWLGRVREFIAR